MVASALTSGRTVAAVDLGAESGRVVAVNFDGSRLATHVQGRFPNDVREVGGILRWNVQDLWSRVSEELSALAATATVTSVGVDTWGVDYALYRADGTFVDDPTCYRDPRQLKAMRHAIRAVGVDALYAAGGTQVLEINTVFALLADALESSRLDEADFLLMMPDIFHHRMSGSRVTERTIASTTGIFDAVAGSWRTDLLQTLGIPSHLLPEVVAPGTDLGPLVGDLADQGLKATRVVAPASHDTASAVVATPFIHPDDVFISSGTWSLVGMERSRPTITSDTLAAGFTNEAGYGSTMLLRNLMGLWLLQECRRQWKRDGTDIGYAQLAEMAQTEPKLRTVINPNAPEFLAPGDMPTKLREYCARHGEPVPATKGAVTRCVIDSLALGYRSVIQDLEAVTGRRPRVISITGGGSQNTVLAQATADATGCAVHCGPVEATALGNGGVQLITAGEIADADELRRVVAASCELKTYHPRQTEHWEDAAERLRRLTVSDNYERGVSGG